MLQKLNDIKSKKGKARFVLLQMYEHPSKEVARPDA